MQLGTETTRKYDKKQTHGICGLSVIPIRKRADDRAEIVSQLLFGEMCVILLKKHNGWTRIQCEWDGYEGWIDSKQILFIGEKSYEKLKQKRAHAIDLCVPAYGDKNYVAVLLGSSLPRYDGISFSMPKEKFRYSGQTLSHEVTEFRWELLRKIAFKYLKAPYLWGGRSPFGIDCSGYVQNVYKMFGIRLPRDAYQQVSKGATINFVEECKLGDLAFFDNEDGRITHVGIILEDREIIHASGEVRIDLLDHFGIYNKSRKKYTHKLRIIKRIINS